MPLPWVVNGSGIGSRSRRIESPCARSEAGTAWRPQADSCTSTDTCRTAAESTPRCRSHETRACRPRRMMAALFVSAPSESSRGHSPRRSLGKGRRSPDALMPMRPRKSRPRPFAPRGGGASSGRRLPSDRGATTRPSDRRRGVSAPHSPFTAAWAPRRTDEPERGARHESKEACRIQRAPEARASQDGPRSGARPRKPACPNRRVRVLPPKSPEISS